MVPIKDGDLPGWWGFAPIPTKYATNLVAKISELGRFGMKWQQSAIGNPEADRGNFPIESYKSALTTMAVPGSVAGAGSPQRLASSRHNSDK